MSFYGRLFYVDNFATLKTLFIIMSIAYADIIFANIEAYSTKPISNKPILLETKLGGIVDIIKLKACRGEYEPVSIVLKSDKEIDKVIVEFDGFKNNNYIFPKNNIDLKIVKLWYQGGGAWTSRNFYKYKSTVLVPELLVNDESLIKIDAKNKKNFVRLKRGDEFVYKDISERASVKGEKLLTMQQFYVKDSKKLQPFSLQKSENKQLWITFKIPKDAINGQYNGSIVFKDIKGLELKRINIELEVLPFLLDKPSITYSIYYRGKLKPDSSTISSEYKSEIQLKSELSNMREHGVYNPTIYQSLRDVHLLKRHLSIREELGISNSTLYYLGIMTYPHKYKTLNNLSKMIKNFQNIAYNKNNKVTYVYGIDEAKDEKLKEQQDSWKVVHDVGAKIFVAGYSGTSKSVGNELDLLVFAGKPNKSEIEQVHSKGKIIFSYNNPQTGPENPYLFRKNYGYVLWANNYDGAMPYAYQHSFGSAWNDLDHDRFRDHNFTYPTVNGVIDTIAWEGFREGIDDVRYINTLERHIKSSNKSQKNLIFLKEAKDYLIYLKNNNISDLDMMRRKLISHILNLKNDN